MPHPFDGSPEYNEIQQPRIAIDAVFFQLDSTGIARLWQSLFHQWSAESFASSILVLNRYGTWPKVDRIPSLRIPPYDFYYRDPLADSRMLQAVCNQHQIDLFVSTYYTSPLDTPSLLMAYDMIPERTNADMRLACWQEKHRGIRHATSAIAISHNTAKDLSDFFPKLPVHQTVVAYPGVDTIFKPASQAGIDSFRARFGIRSKYIVTAGRRSDYKNAALLFKALATMADRDDYDVVCIGGEPILDADSRTAVGDRQRVHLLRLSDNELAVAYSGAVALVYPSRYEGFGLPPLEAMACGCPVITTRRGSLPEVGGDAFLYIDPDSIEQMVSAIQSVQIPEDRRRLSQAGLARANLFSWAHCSNIVRDTLIAESNRLSIVANESKWES